MSTFGVRADTNLQAALRTFASQAVELKASDFLFHQGDKPHGCYLIKSGKMRLSLDAVPGLGILRRVVGPGCVVGLPATINGHVYSLSCEAIEDAELAHLSKQDVALLIKSNTAAAMKLLDLLSSEIQAVRAEMAKMPKTTAMKHS